MLHQELISYQKNKGLIGKNSLENYEILRTISITKNSRVYLTKEIITKEKYVIKKIDKSKILQTAKGMEYIQNEKKILQTNHPFMVTLLHGFQCKRHVYFVMNYYERGTLANYMENLPGGTLTEQEIVFYASEILVALEFLHEMNVIHRDLKLDNILIDDEGHIKLTDFGYSKIIDDDNNDNEEKEVAYSCVGTIYYFAPEVIDPSSSASYGKYVDLWAFGICIYEMLTADVPFNGDTIEEIINEIRFQNNILFPEHASKKIIDLVEKLLRKDKKERLKSIPIIKKHSFFENVEFDKILHKQYNVPKNRATFAVDCGHEKKELLLNNDNDIKKVPL